MNSGEILHPLRRDRHVDGLIRQDGQRAGPRGVETAAMIDGDVAVERHQRERGWQQQARYGDVRIGVRTGGAGLLAEGEQARLHHQRIEGHIAAARSDRYAAVRAHAGDVGHQIDRCRGA